MGAPEGQVFGKNWQEKCGPFDHGTYLNSRWVRGNVKRIEHSGQVFHALGWCEKHGCYIWPIEEFFARVPYQFSHVVLTPALKQKLLRLNPNGKCETRLPEGWPG